MFEGLLQPTHLVLILVIALIAFGPSRLPELGGALGKSIREFKKSTEDIQEIKDSVRGTVESTKGAVTSAVTVQPRPAATTQPVAQVTTQPAAPLATTPDGTAPAPLPTQPETRHDTRPVLARELID